MPKQENKDLLKFLKPFSAETTELALWLRDMAWDLIPDSNELIYDNPNAVAFGWSLSDRLGDTFLSIAVMRTNQNVLFGFYFGKSLKDPGKLLQGKGSQFRYIPAKDKKTFPLEYVKKLVFQAHANAVKKAKQQKDKIEGHTIVKTSDKVRGDLPAKKSSPKKAAVKKPEAVQAEVKKPEVNIPEPKKPEVKLPEAKKPEPKKPEPKKPETKKSQPKKAEAKKPEPKKAEAKKAEVKKSEAKRPEVKKPDVKKPNVKKSAPMKTAPKKTSKKPASKSKA